MKRGTEAKRTPVCSAAWHGGACNRPVTARGLCTGHYASVHLRGRTPGPLRERGTSRKKRRPPRRLPRALDEALAALSEETGLPFATHLREAVESYLAARKKSPRGDK